MALRWYYRRLLVVVLLFVAGPAFAQTPTTATTTAPPPGKAAVKTDMVPSLIVMNAHGAGLQGSTLTLTGVSPNSIVFADRPVRAAGHVLAEHLVEEWSTGSFARDPPNATVSVLSRDGASTELFGSWIWSLGEAFVCTIEAWLREDSQVRPLLERGRGWQRGIRRSTGSSSRCGICSSRAARCATSSNGQRH
jgi:hypothetical protein